MLLVAQVLGQFGVQCRLNLQLGEHFLKIFQIMLSLDILGKFIRQFL